MMGSRNNLLEICDRMIEKYPEAKSAICSICDRSLSSNRDSAIDQCIKLLEEIDKQPRDRAIALLNRGPIQINSFAGFGAPFSGTWWLKISLGILRNILILAAIGCFLYWLTLNF